jgi:dihydrofolate reductase
MINALLAVDQFGGMGFNGTLPWPHDAEDMANFARLTKNHIVVMGRRTWDDPKMPKPLLGRIVYVATNRAVDYANSITGDLRQHLVRLEKENPDRKIWVVGGTEIFDQCAGMFDRIYMTHMAGVYRNDKKIQINKMLTGFRPVRCSHTPGSKATFITYESVFKGIRE